MHHSDAKNRENEKGSVCRDPVQTQRFLGNLSHFRYEKKLIFRPNCTKNVKCVSSDACMRAVFFKQRMSDVNFGGNACMRKSPIAGSWYPGNSAELTKLVTELLDDAQLPELKGRPYGLISPHAGIQFSGSAAACAYKALQGLTVKRVILMGPSHYTCMYGMAVSGVDAYETPLGKVRVDRKICDALARQPLFQGPVQAEMPEHSLEMQLPFLQIVLGEFELVPLVVGELGRHDYAVAAAELKKYVNEETVVVVSSDFTHYGPRFGYVPFSDKLKQNLAKLDGDAIKKIIARDASGFLRYVDETGATICGSRPIGVLLQMLPSEARGTKLIYYTSGDLLKDYADSVSYASIIFTVSQNNQ